jgi:2,5-furandicarboxylate decarboxylase 1
MDIKSHRGLILRNDTKKSEENSVENINDLRSFLAVLKNNGQLAEITREVDPVHEIGSVIATLEREHGPAALFKNVKGFKGTVAGGLLSDYQKIAMALGCTPGEITDRMEAVLDNPILPKKVSSAPCQDVVLTGNQVDLTAIPIPTHAPLDGGPFITAGVTVGRDLETGIQNLSFQRMHIKGPKKMGIMINEWRHLRDFLNKAEAEGSPLPVAVAIGVDPVIMIAAGFRYDGDEAALAGGLRGSAIERVKCVTSDILVPATSEYVIEGEIIPGVREEEGPLAEFTGHYGMLWKSPVVEVKAITHRKDAIWQTLNGASFEHINLGNVLPREPLLRRHTRYVSKNVTAVHIPPYGSGFLAVVQLNKSNEGEPKNVAMAAMTTYVNIKNVIVVDTDVDIHNPADILWALSNRVDPREDIFVVPNSQGHELDPCSDKTGVQNKMGIDATLSAGRKELQKAVYPTVDLSKYLNR